MRTGLGRQMKKAMAAAPGCDQKIHHRSAGTSRTHTRRRNCIKAKGFSVFFSSCMMRKEQLLKHPSVWLRESEREKGEREGNPDVHRAPAAIPAAFRIKK